MERGLPFKVVDKENRNTSKNSAKKIHERKQGNEQGAEKIENFCFHKLALQFFAVISLHFFIINAARGAASLP